MVKKEIQKKSFNQEDSYGHDDVNGNKTCENSELFTNDPLFEGNNSKKYEESKSYKEERGVGGGSPSEDYGCIIADGPIVRLISKESIQSSMDNDKVGDHYKRHSNKYIKGVYNKEKTEIQCKAHNSEICVNRTFNISDYDLGVFKSHRKIDSASYYPGNYKI
jgi:hypothetical protein